MKASVRIFVAVGGCLMLFGCADLHFFWIATTSPTAWRQGTPDTITKDRKSNIRNMTAEKEARKSLEISRNEFEKRIISLGQCPKDLKSLRETMVMYEETMTISSDVTMTPDCKGGWYYDQSACTLFINSCELDSSGKKRYIDW
jgi:hypothetical protein